MKKNGHGTGLPENSGASRRYQSFNPNALLPKGVPGISQRGERENFENLTQIGVFCMETRLVRKSDNF